MPLFVLGSPSGTVGGIIASRVSVLQLRQQSHGLIGAFSDPAHAVLPSFESLRVPACLCPKIVAAGGSTSMLLASLSLLQSLDNAKTDMSLRSLRCPIVQLHLEEHQALESSAPREPDFLVLPCHNASFVGDRIRRPPQKYPTNSHGAALMPV